MTFSVLVVAQYVPLKKESQPSPLSIPCKLALEFVLKLCLMQHFYSVIKQTALSLNFPSRHPPY